MLFGFITGGLGIWFFPVVMSILTGLFTLYSVVIISSTLKAIGAVYPGWIPLIIGLIGGILAGIRFLYIVPKSQVLTVSIISGFYTGVLLLACITAVSGWTAIWAFYLFSIVLAVVSIIVTTKIGLDLIRYHTSFLASYFFVRGLTLLFWT